MKLSDTSLAKAIKEMRELQSDPKTLIHIKPTKVIFVGGKP